MSDHIAGYEHPESINAYNSVGGGYKFYTEDSHSDDDNVYVSRNGGANYRTFMDGETGDAYIVQQENMKHTSTDYSSKVRARPVNQGSGFAEQPVQSKQVTHAQPFYTPSQNTTHPQSDVAKSARFSDKICDNCGANIVYCRCKR